MPEPSHTRYLHLSKLVCNAHGMYKTGQCRASGKVPSCLQTTRHFVQEMTFVPQGVCVAKPTAAHVHGGFVPEGNDDKERELHNPNGLLFHPVASTQTVASI